MRKAENNTHTYVYTGEYRTDSEQNKYEVNQVEKRKTTLNNRIIYVKANLLWMKEYVGMSEEIIQEKLK